MSGMDGGMSAPRNIVLLLAHDLGRVEPPFHSALARYQAIMDESKTYGHL